MHLSIGSLGRSILFGRKAADQIHKYLGGIPTENPPKQQLPKPLVVDRETFLSKRIDLPKLPIDKCISSFSHIELSIDKDKAIHEASRCLQCDLCLYLSEGTKPPINMVLLTCENVDMVPERPGVYTLFDSDKKIIEIKGTVNLKKMLSEKVGSNETSTYFKYEENQMYSKRESELLQQYVKQHGEIPSGGDELDDLF
jgi:hypothetical protein